MPFKISALEDEEAHVGTVDGSRVADMVDVSTSFTRLSITGPTLMEAVDGFILAPKTSKPIIVGTAAASQATFGSVKPPASQNGSITSSLYSFWNNELAPSTVPSTRSGPISGFEKGFSSMDPSAHAPLVTNKHVYNFSSFTLGSSISSTSVAGTTISFPSPSFSSSSFPSLASFNFTTRSLFSSISLPSTAATCSCFGAPLKSTSMATITPSAIASSNINYSSTRIVLPSSSSTSSLSKFGPSSSLPLTFPVSSPSGSVPLETIKRQHAGIGGSFVSNDFGGWRSRMRINVASEGSFTLSNYGSGRRSTKAKGKHNWRRC